MVYYVRSNVRGRTYFYNRANNLNKYIMGAVIREFIILQIDVFYHHIIICVG